MELTLLKHRIEELEATVASLTRDKAELEAILQLKSQSLFHFAHELRTPLVAIRGYTKMILDGTAGEVNDTQREYLTIVVENANRLMGVVSSFLHLATGRQLRLEAFDVRDLWRESLRWLRPKVAEKAITIKEKVAPHPLMVAGDREKLTLVFQKLLSNALRFTGHEGEISVEISRGRDSEIMIRVSDTGVGIPREVLDKLFDRYRQSEAISYSPDGLAAGLSTVNDIVRVHGGRISVASKVGEGSTFFFTLPVLNPASNNLASNQEVKLHNEQASSSGRR